MINYLSTSKQLVAMVQATRGNKPAEAVDIQLLVPPTSLGSGKTDRNGRVTLTVDISYPSKTYPLIAETIGGEYAQTVSAFTVPQPYELTEDSPLVNLEVVSVEVGDDFVLVANVTARRGAGPIPYANVRIDYNDGGLNQMEQASLNGIGVTSKRLTIPISGRKKVVASIRATVDVAGSPSDVKVVTLERTIKRPAQMTYLSRMLNNNTQCELTLIVEDGEGKPIKGVPLTAASNVGDMASTTDTTDEYGRVRFTITLAPENEHEYTDCVVDCPGLLDMARFNIRRPRVPGWCSGRGPIIGAGISLLFAMILFALVPFGIIRNIGSFLDHPTVENIVVPPVDSLRNATENDAYKYLTYEVSKPDSTDAGSKATTPARDGWSFTTYLWLLFWCGICLVIAIIFALVSLFCRANQLYEWIEGFIRERRYGVADNEPNLWGRLLNRYVGHNDGKGEVVTATGAKPAAGQPAMSAKDKGSSLNHWMPVILYGIGDFFFERIIHLFTKSKVEKNEKK